MKKILIVEDEAIIALMLKKRLTSLNYNVIAIARTGIDAIEKAKEHSPDFIIMDVKINGEMTGIDAAREIKKFSDVPVIFTTGNSNINFNNEFKNFKGIEVLIKPIDFERLNKILSPPILLNINIETVK